MDALTLNHVSKSFGNHKVIDNLSLTVLEHGIYGFIGENGAGKTTTMKMILGLLKADSGEILVNGERVSYGQNHTNKYIGYLPDVPEFYDFMTPLEYLILCGKVTGMEKNSVRKRAKELLDMVGLAQNGKRIHGFSRGMKQRLGIAQALLNSPQLLICDEPTSALDPVGRKEILDILLAVKEHTTVLFSTHILSDVERICDRIGFLHQGKLAFSGTMEEIRNQYSHVGFVIEFCSEKDAKRFARDIPGGQFTDRLQIFYDEGLEQDMQAAIVYLAENKMAVQKIEMLEPSLEALFMEVVGK